MQGSFATEGKKERLNQFLRLLKECDNMPLKKCLALSELKLGIRRETALHYLEIFREVEFVTIQKEIIKLKEGAKNG